MVKDLRSNLLGLPAITALNGAARLDEGTAPTPAALTTPLTPPVIYEHFPTAFQGLGNLGEDYQIKLKPDAAPFALFTPRRVPLPLRQKVAAELECMETMGVISKVPPRGVQGW